jgi:predicted membrane-bound spermidine synthase
MKSVIDHAMAFLAGACIMLVELVGARMLAPIFGTGIFVWASLLSVVLAALATGYFIGGVLSRKVPALEARHLLLAAAVLLGGADLIREPVLRFADEFGLRFGPLVASTLLFFPCELLYAAISPVVAERCKTKSVGMIFGRISALASLGSIVGALCTGFLLIPGFSLKVLFPAAVLVLGVFSFLSCLASGREAERLLSLLPLALFMTTLLLGAGKTLGEHLLHRGWSSYGQLDVFDIANARILLIDGMIHTVMPKGLIGEPSAEDARMPGNYFSLLKAFHPDGKEALVIGLGGGLIPKLLSTEGVSTDSVEIDPGVVVIARRHFGFKGSAVVGDGRRFLRHCKKTYDFIVIDAFASDQLATQLFSRECFEEVSARLRESGILSINFIASPRGRVTASLKKTLETVFPNVLFVPSKGDESVQVLYVFASNEPLRLTGPSHISETELHSCQQLLAYPPSKGVVVTDDRNPLELEWAAVAADWRRDSKRYLDFLLSTVE